MSIVLPGFYHDVSPRLLTYVDLFWIFFYSVYIVVFLSYFFVIFGGNILAAVALWTRHWPPKPGIVGLSLNWGDCFV